MEKEKKKMGRPKVDNPKNNNIKVKVDDKTYKILSEYAKNKNKSVASVIREAIEEKLKIKS